MGVGVPGLTITGRAELLGGHHPRAIGHFAVGQRGYFVLDDQYALAANAVRSSTNSGDAARNDNG